MTSVENRQAIEHKVVRHLIRSMKEKGWDISYINDGGEPDEDTHNPSEAEAMDVVFSVDESTIHFRKQLSAKVGMTHYALIVLGNDGWDCIADHSCSKESEPKDDFEAVMNKVSAYCEKQEA